MPKYKIQGFTRIYYEAVIDAADRDAVDELDDDDMELIEVDSSTFEVTSVEEIKKGILP